MSNCVFDSLMLLGSHNELNAMQFKFSLFFFFFSQKYTALFIASEIYIALYIHFFFFYSVLYLNIILERQGRVFFPLGLFYF